MIEAKTFHKSEGSDHFWGFKVLNFNIFLGGGGVGKKNIFGDMKFLWIFFGGHHRTGLVLGIISMYFRIFFFKVKVQNGNIF